MELTQTNNHVLNYYFFYRRKYTLHVHSTFNIKIFVKDNVAEKTLIQVSKDLYVYIQKHIYIYYIFIFFLA